MKAKIKGDSVVVSGYVNAVERNSVPLRYMRRGNEHTGKRYVERVPVSYTHLTLPTNREV